MLLLSSLRIQWKRCALYTECLNFVMTSSPQPWFGSRWAIACSGSAALSASASVSACRLPAGPHRRFGFVTCRPLHVRANRALPQTLIKRTKHGDEGDVDRRLAAGIMRSQRYKQSDFDAGARRWAHAWAAWAHAWLPGSMPGCLRTCLPALLPDALENWSSVFRALKARGQ